MADKLTKRFNLFVADSVKDNIASANNELYVFYSRVHPWANVGNPPAIVDSVQYSDYDIWRGMVGLKRITVSDVSLAIDRHDWSSGTVYGEYDNNDDQLFDRSPPFYVYSSNNNVYKCLFNNNGAQSTVVPSGQSTSPTTTSDGYIWKFMYQVAPADQNKFQTGNFIPVKKVGSDGSPQKAVQDVAVSGTVDIIDVVSGGSNYLVASGNVVSVTNTSVMVVDDNASGNSSVYNNYSINIISGTGLGQVRTISDYSGGTTKTVTLASAFNVAPDTTSKYHIGPAINITGDGTGTTAYANVMSGSISKVNVITAGSGHSKIQVDVGSTSYGSGATVKGYLSPVGGHGSNPVSELLGRAVVINALLEGNENNTFVANNDFRIYGIMRNPVLRSTGALATGTRYNQTLRFDTVSRSGTFVQDEFVVGGTSGASGRLVTFDSNTVFLTNVSGTFANSEIVTANTSGAQATINGITLPDLLPYRGELIYSVNREAISRDIDQTENITIAVKF